MLKDLAFLFFSEPEWKYAAYEYDFTNKGLIVKGYNGGVHKSKPEGWNNVVHLQHTGIKGVYSTNNTHYPEIIHHFTGFEVIKKTDLIYGWADNVEQILQHEKYAPLINSARQYILGLYRMEKWNINTWHGFGDYIGNRTYKFGEFPPNGLTSSEVLDEVLSFRFCEIAPKSIIVGTEAEKGTLLQPGTDPNDLNQDDLTKALELYNQGIAEGCNTLSELVDEHGKHKIHSC